MNEVGCIPVITENVNVCNHFVDTTSLGLESGLKLVNQSSVQFGGFFGDLENSLNEEGEFNLVDLEPSSPPIANRVILGSDEVQPLSVAYDDNEIFLVDDLFGISNSRNNYESVSSVLKQFQDCFVLDDTIGISKFVGNGGIVSSYTDDVNFFASTYYHNTIVQNNEMNTSDTSEDVSHDDATSKDIFPSYSYGLDGGPLCAEISQVEWPRVESLSNDIVSVSFNVVSTTKSIFEWRKFSIFALVTVDICSEPKCSCVARCESQMCAEFVFKMQLFENISAVSNQEVLVPFFCDFFLLEDIFVSEKTMGILIESSDIEKQFEIISEFKRAIQEALRLTSNHQDGRKLKLDIIFGLTNADVQCVAQKIAVREQEILNSVFLSIKNVFESDRLTVKKECVSSGICEVVCMYL